MNEEQIRYFIHAEKEKGTSTNELIFILYEISNYLDISVKYIEELLSDD